MTMIYDVKLPWYRGVVILNDIKTELIVQFFRREDASEAWFGEPEYEQSYNYNGKNIRTAIQYCNRIINLSLDIQWSADNSQQFLERFK